jgi:hypothetical protein
MLTNIGTLKKKPVPTPATSHDIIIKAKARRLRLMASYTVLASPKREPLTLTEVDQMKTLKPIDEVVSKLLAAQAGGDTKAAVQQPA